MNTLLNVGLFRNPYNWLVVALMLAFAGYGLALFNPFDE